MTDKVKLPREVADAICHLKTHHGGNETILSGILGNANGSCIVTIREYCYSPSVNFDIVLSALVNGFEIEETPEDKVREYFILNRDNLVNPNSYYSNEVKCETVIHVLDLLNIKIEGVNA